MDETPHRHERLQCRFAIDGHVEDVAVRTPQRGILVWPERGLFTAQPAVPRRHAAGAVAQGAGEAGARVGHAARHRIEGDGGGTAARPLVVGDRRIERRAGVQFVIANQDDRAVGPGKRGHAVVPAGRACAGVERIADPAERAVAKPFRQLQQRHSRGLVLDWPERAVPLVVRRHPAGPGRTPECFEGNGDGRPAGKGSLQEEIASWRAHAAQLNLVTLQECNVSDRRRCRRIAVVHVQARAVPEQRLRLRSLPVGETRSSSRRQRIVEDGP